MRSRLHYENKLGVGIGLKLLFFVQANANVKFGLFTTAKAKTPKECVKLAEFGNYNAFRRNPIVPQWLTNKIYGGALGKEGYQKAEAKQSGAVEILAKDGRNYVEEGKSIGGDANAGVKFLASANASGQAEGFKKRITRDVVKKALMETGKVSDLDFDKLGAEYERQSEGGSDGETKSSTIHKALDKNKDTSHKASRRSRTETKLVKKGKVIKEY